ncbi:MAG: SDR family NAD(P)-dependent oxidoreductase [Acidimicrobiales bacterium]
MPVAIVTGASRGFGRALALDLAEDQWSLVIDGRRARELDEIKETLKRLGTNVSSIVGDVTDPNHRAVLIESAKSFGALDLLVNNASTLGPSPLPRLEDYPLDDLRRVYEVNTVAPLALIQASLQLLRRSRGTVVTVSSDAAVEAYEGWGGYGSSKAAIDQLNQVLAVEEEGVHCYAFDPGDMRTDMHQAAFPGEDISDRPLPESVVPIMRQLLASSLPSGRYRASEWEKW